MTLRDFLILVAVSLIWSVNNVISKVVVGMWHVPPMFYADLRFAVVLLVTLPWLRPAPRPLWRLLLIGTLLGGGRRLRQERRHGACPPDPCGGGRL